MNAKKIPEIFAMRKNDQLVFNCWRCGETHFHSLGEGYRQSLCEGWPDGYYLMESRHA